MLKIKKKNICIIEGNERHLVYGKIEHTHLPFT